MGISISWFAVAMKPANDLLKELKLRDTGAPAVPGSAKFAGASLPNGWFVIALNEFWHPMIHPESIEPLSSDCVVVGCAEIENANSSLAFLYREGQQVWHVSHILDEGEGHLEIDGNPPESTDSILAHARKKAREENFDAVFSVPVTLAHEICGFRHDKHSDVRFTELAQIPVLPGAQVVAAILSRLEPLLKASGFTKGASGNTFVTFSAKTAGDEIKCTFNYMELPGGGCTPDILLEVRNDFAHGLARAAEKLVDPAARARDWTFRRHLSNATELPEYVETEDDLAAWIASAEFMLPSLIERFHDIKALDALTNDESPRVDVLGRSTLSHYDPQTGFARLVLAYLASNPNFARMVAETDAAYRGGASPTNGVHQVVAYLRAHAKPVG